MLGEQHHHALALFEGGLDSFTQTGFATFVHTQAVDDQLDVVNLVAIDLHVVGELLYLAIDAHPKEPFHRHLGEELAVVTLAAAHQRGEDDDFLLGVVVVYDVEYLLLGELHHLLARCGRVGVGHAGVEQAHEVVYLGHRAHRRAWVLVGGLLFDGYDGA